MASRFFFNLSRTKSLPAYFGLSKIGYFIPFVFHNCVKAMKVYAGFQLCPHTIVKQWNDCIRLDLDFLSMPICSPSVQCRPHPNKYIEIKKEKITTNIHSHLKGKHMCTEYFLLLFFCIFFLCFSLLLLLLFSFRLFRLSWLCCLNFYICF